MNIPWYAGISILFWCWRTYFDRQHKHRQVIALRNDCLCRGNWSSYQALNPREQEEAILANSDAELEKIADSVLSDKYCPDKKRISEDTIADRIRANQDVKEMTKRAIQILKKKGAEYKDLEKEYEKIYGDKLIFDEK